MDLATFLTANGTTEQQIAVAVGCSQSTINKIKHGKVNPSLSILRAISAATNGAVTPNDFLPATSPGGGDPGAGETRQASPAPVQPSKEAA